MSIEGERTSPRNLFEVDNARYLSTEEVVQTFIPTHSFWRLLSAKNHIVLGARGSGKTAMLRMLSHNHLARFKDKRALKLVASRTFVGIYLPAKADWVGGLKNKPWQSEKEKEEFFRWRLNLASCLALISAVESCLKSYIADEADRLRCDSSIATALSTNWQISLRPGPLLTEISRTLEDLDFRKQVEIARTRAHGNQVKNELGTAFDTELFQPLRRGIALASPLLELPANAIWMLCLDEAEALEPFHHRIINSYLRTHSENLVFKVSTTPYGHHTLETNVGASLNEGDDFEYVYIDNDIRGGVYQHPQSTYNEARLFAKRARRSGRSYKHLTLAKLLGTSDLLEPKELSEDVAAYLLQYVRENGDESLVQRANNIFGDHKKFGNEIGRKIHGAALLRTALRGVRGQQEVDVYSGAAMVVRCCDGNPRRLIRLFNKLLSEGDWRSSTRGETPYFVAISATRQTQILRDFSTSLIARVQGEPEYGRDLHYFLFRIGSYMRNVLHEQPLSSDTVGSISVDENTDPAIWRLLYVAVGLGLLYPNVHPKNPDKMPQGQSTFRLAYALAPAFYLLPRRGKARKIETIMQRQYGPTSSQLDLRL